MTEQTDAPNRVRGSFAKQGVMELLGARVVEVDRGVRVIELPFRDELTRQRRYFHDAVTRAIGESAGGYGASSTSALTRQYTYENNA